MYNPDFVKGNQAGVYTDKIWKYMEKRSFGSGEKHGMAVSESWWNQLAKIFQREYWKQ